VGKLTATTSQGSTKQVSRVKLPGSSPVKKVLQAGSEISSKMESREEARAAIGLLLAEQGSAFYTFYLLLWQDLNFHQRRLMRR